MLHHTMVRMMGGRLWLAPIDKNKVQTVLDVGTGTGARMCWHTPTLGNRF